MHDSIRKVYIENKIITWHYLFVPITKSEKVSELSEITPLYGTPGLIETAIINSLFGHVRGFIYKFKNGNKFGIINLDMNNSKLLFEYLLKKLDEKMLTKQ